MVFDGYTSDVTILGPGQFDGKSSGNWARVAFASRSIDGLSSTLKGIRATCASGTHWALGLTSNAPSSYSTWTHLSESYTSGAYGFHPTSSGTIHSGPTTGCTPSCSSISWGSTTSFELRVKSNGYIDYVKCETIASSCAVFATSASSVSVWPLHFGLSVYNTGTFGPTCSNLQWLSAADVATW